MKATSASPEENLGVELGGVVMGKYRIESILGQGGMGVVARATHLHLNEMVAIKFLRADIAGDDEANQRFLREAHAVWKLKNEHVARVIDVGSLDNGLPYLVMEYLEGVDLDGMLEQSARVAPPLAVEFIVQACEGLAEAHSFGIIHRDVKPSNFFVTWRGDGTPLVKLLDFGISKLAGSTDVSLTQTQSMLGTPAYMSPEQMRSARAVDQRTDVWSLGAVLFELIEGTRPFEAESFSEMCVKVAVDPPAPFTVPIPPGLDAVVRRCLEKAPEARFANVGEVAAALAPFAPSPQAAMQAVERIHRQLQRASAPMMITDAKSAPVAIPREDVLAAYPPRRTTPWAGGGAVPMPSTPTPTPWSAPHERSNPAMTPLPAPLPTAPPTNHASPTIPPMMSPLRRSDDELSRTAFTPRAPRTSAPMTTQRRVGRIAVVAVVLIGAAIAAIVLLANGGSGSGDDAEPSASGASGSDVVNGAGTGADVVDVAGTRVDAGVVDAAVTIDASAGPASGSGSGSASGSGSGSGSGSASGSASGSGSGSASGSGAGSSMVGAGSGSGKRIVGPSAGSGKRNGSGSGTGKRNGSGSGSGKRNGSGSQDDIFGKRK